MDLGLKGKIALVAASSQGLGLAVAHELAAEGASLVMNARNAETLAAACDSVGREHGVDVLAAAGDVSAPEDIERIVSDAIDRFGRVDILVTNSGGPPAGTFENFDIESWDKATRVLLTSVVEMTRLVLPGMKKRGWGRILNITSIAAKQPVSGLMLSNTLRAGVTGFSKTLAAEVAPFGITANTILPGYTATDRVTELAENLAKKEGVEPSDIHSRWEAEIPLGRLAEPREFAALAAFLVSERASYITGSSVAVDGGWIKSVF